MPENESVEVEMCTCGCGATKEETLQKLMVLNGCDHHQAEAIYTVQEMRMQEEDSLIRFLQRALSSPGALDAVIAELEAAAKQEEKASE